MDSSAADLSVHRIEIDLLMRLAEPFKSILDATETDAYTIHQKNDAWTEISKQYNLDRRFKKKTCRELRKTYQRMVIKNRSRSQEMQLEEDKKPKPKRFKFSYNEEILEKSNNSDVLKRDIAFVPPPDDKPIENFWQKSMTSDKKYKKEKNALSKNCMVIMRPITKAQLKAISNSQSKVLSSASSKSPPKIQESSVPSSASSFIKLSPQRGTPASSAGHNVHNVGVMLTIGSGNIVKSSPTHSGLSNMVSLGQRGLGGASSPRQASSPTHPNAISPSRERYTSSVAVAGSNFSSTPGSATLTTMTAQTGSGSVSDISVASSTLQPQPTEEVCKKTVINTYSKIHPQVVRQAESTSPQRTHVVKHLVWPTTMQHTSLVSASPKVSSCQSRNFISAAKGASCKPADEVTANSAGSKRADEPSISTPPKVADSKLGAVTLTTTKVASSKTANVRPSSSPQRVTISTPGVAVTAASSPTVVASKPAAAVSLAVPLKVVSCMPTSVIPTATSPRFAKGKFSKIGLASATHKLQTASSVPDSEKTLSAAKVAVSQLSNITVSGTSTTVCQTARDVDTSSANYARCQLVPTSQAFAFLSRSTVRSHLKDNVATSSKSSSITASAESEPTVLTTSVTTPGSGLAASSGEFTSPTLPTVQALEEGQNEGINVALAEPEILNIRVLEANLDVRAAQARVEAEEALREEALAKLAMTRAEMDHQALRHKIELRHMRRLNALALKHAKELHVAALSLRRKE